MRVIVTKERQQHALQIVRDHNEHQSLSAERERLRHALRRMLDSFSPYPTEDTERWREEWEAYEEARLLLLNEQGKESG